MEETESFSHLADSCRSGFRALSSGRTSWVTATLPSTRCCTVVAARTSGAGSRVLCFEDPDGEGSQVGWLAACVAIVVVLVVTLRVVLLRGEGVDVLLDVDPM